MQFLGYSALLLGLFASMAGVFFGAYTLYYGGRVTAVSVLEKANKFVCGATIFASCLLLLALVAKDYSFAYVFGHVSNSLSFIYTIIAFWAGREGSLLFWQFFLALCALLFMYTPSYGKLSSPTKIWFWMLILLVQGFFLLLLVAWSNPFAQRVTTDIMKLFDGRGMNPLLRNPGMIIHPPLLLMGYAQFAIPAALGLASLLANEKQSWISLSRTWILLGWMFLTAGNILGAWWAYMELGWGGYWAWDPVENSSLIPWFVATAFLHTAIIEKRTKSLVKTNVFLMALTFLLCVFGTYLTRSGVVQSIHTFGANPIALPLEVFMTLFLGIMIATIVSVKKTVKVPELEQSFMSQSGMLLFTAWFFLGLGLVVFLATLAPIWLPVAMDYMSSWANLFGASGLAEKLLDNRDIGLDAAFYNRVCLPLLTGIVLILLYCPFASGKNRKISYAAFGIFVLMTVAFRFVFSMDIMLSSIAAGAGVAVVVSILYLLIFTPEGKSNSSLGAHGVHIGVGLMALGIAFSGPYQIKASVSLEEGKSAQVGAYTFVYKGLETVETKAINPNTKQEEVAMTSQMASVEAFDNKGNLLGVLEPERRVYQHWEENIFSEVDVIPRVGDELYATLTNFNEEKNIAVFQFAINPLINWLWLGGILVALMPIVSLIKRRKKQ